MIWLKTGSKIKLTKKGNPDISVIGWTGRDLEMDQPLVVYYGDTNNPDINRYIRTSNIDSMTIDKFNPHCIEVRTQNSIYLLGVIAEE